MPFAEIIAQDRALASLRSALRRGALHHAYLFGGPEGTGKAIVARVLAQAANCEAGEGGPAGFRDDACGTCGPCRKIGRGLHPDVFVLRDERTMAKEGRWEPKGGRTPSRDVVVDQVRDLVDHRLAMKRFEGRRRFVIVDPADAMNPQAQNALLKTLEEPPDDTTLVLVAASPDRLLPTIRSRCLRVPFGPIPAEIVEARLRADGRAPEEARLAAALAGGSLGRALALDPEELGALRDSVLAAVALDPGDAGAWLAFAKAHGEDRQQAAELCELLALWLRDVLAARAGGDRLALAELEAATRRAAGALAPAEVVRRRAEVQRTAAALRQNASPVLALERLLIGWFHGRA
ncbi:DNA polymerase III subunit delta' [Anaeromyxobacter oryzae]|uniref:DNA polymerase III subunit delta n=1 Tax=Anaeromyxobacter oryzae TaxID=2918170 RepID=A0ABM7X348_9BACT|nr:DNA polymerase III subunit delta' [Anaeromyxobacter oryzae]BDG06227.1 DNA polymerase III subunit delta' [Anaeromyxobacter oryzae]